jgi:hypothetical protein
VVEAASQPQAKMWASREGDGALHDLAKQPVGNAVLVTVEAGGSDREPVEDILKGDPELAHQRRKTHERRHALGRIAKIPGPEGLVQHS